MGIEKEKREYERKKEAEYSQLLQKSDEMKMMLGRIQWNVCSNKFNEMKIMLAKLLEKAILDVQSIRDSFGIVFTISPLINDKFDMLLDLSYEIEEFLASPLSICWEVNLNMKQNLEEMSKMITDIAAEDRNFSAKIIQPTRKIQNDLMNLDMWLQNIK